MSPHKQRLLAEILEQPRCLEALLEGFPENFDGMRLPGAFTQKLISIGEGSSYNALKIAAPFIEQFTGLNTFTFDPESLDNKFDIAQSIDQPIKRLFERSFFLSVSQSGKTASILQIVEKLQEALGFSDGHAPMIPLTNNPEGTLATRYNNHFDLQVGTEQSIAATKSMTASMMALLLFGIRLGQKRSWLSRPLYADFVDTLREIPETLQLMLDDESFHEKLQAYSQGLCQTNQFVLLSKGILSSILPEVGLKLTETSRNIVWTDNTESFKHGRKVILYGVKGVRPNCLYVIPPNLSEAEAARLFNDIYSHFYVDDEQVFSTEGVFLTIFENSPAMPEAFKKALNIREANLLVLPEADGIASLFVGLVSFQLLAYYLALAKGEDPNNPALQKAVIR